MYYSNGSTPKSAKVRGRGSLLWAISRYLDRHPDEKVIAECQILPEVIAESVVIS
jgi:hypothetical protein